MDWSQVLGAGGVIGAVLILARAVESMAKLALRMWQERKHSPDLSGNGKVLPHSVEVLTEIRDYGRETARCLQDLRDLARAGASEHAEIRRDLDSLRSEMRDLAQ